MLIANKNLPQGQGLSPVLLRRATTVELDWDARQRSRFDATDSAGRQLGVFLPRGSVVRGGDVLVAEDGSMIRVIAQAQPVMRAALCASHGAAFDLLRAAYHLGNRHVALQLTPTHLQFEPDHVLAEMLRQMHLVVTEELVAFEPEGGAYSADASHGHAHGHAAAPARKPIPIEALDGHPHVHGPGCDHGH